MKWPQKHTVNDLPVALGVIQGRINFFRINTYELRSL